MYNLYSENKGADQLICAFVLCMCKKTCFLMRRFKYKIWKHYVNIHLSNIQGVRRSFSGQFFRIFEIILFFFVVAIYVHNVEAIPYLYQLLIASGNISLNMSDALKLQFAVSGASLIFQKRFPDFVSS